MSRKHTKHVREHWNEMTEDERDASILRGLLHDVWNKAMSVKGKDPGGVLTAQRRRDALQRALARLEPVPAPPASGTPDNHKE
ncbi:MAG TPA: hypothetical protein VMT56_00435 [Candidatus Bathyarchaeia archaeon]|nr:hypothetical protein [Candidatus Bathyarchaeia archaeon]